MDSFPRFAADLMLRVFPESFEFACNLGFATQRPLIISAHIIVHTEQASYPLGMGPLSPFGNFRCKRGASAQAAAYHHSRDGRKHPGH